MSIYIIEFIVKLFALSFGMKFAFLIGWGNVGLLPGEKFFITGRPETLREENCC
jgi:hypothetical protein